MRLQSKHVSTDLNEFDRELFQDYASYCMDELGYIPDEEELCEVLDGQIKEQDSWNDCGAVLWNWAILHRLDEYEIKNQSLIKAINEGSQTA